MLDKIFDIDSIQSYLSTGFDWFGLNVEVGMQKLINWLVNSWFGLIKLLVQGINFVVGKVYTLNILTEKLDSVFETGSQIWDQLFSVFGLLFFSCVLIVLIKDFMKRGIEKVFFRLAMFTALFIISTGFFSSGATYLQTIHNLSQEAQGQLVKVMSPKSNQLTQELLAEFGTPETEEPSEVIQNQVCSVFILQTYALLNFGKSDIPKEDYTTFLLKNGDDYEQRNKEIKKAVEDRAENGENRYMTFSKIQDKLAVLLNATLMLVVIGTAILLISLMNFVIQLLILALVLVFGCLCILSLFPDKGQILFNGFKTFGGLFIGKALIGAGFGLLFTVIDWIDGAFGAVNIVTVIASLLIKLVVGFLVWKNKATIFRYLSEGKGGKIDMPSPSKFFQNQRQSKANKENTSRKNEMQNLQQEKLENELIISQIEIESAEQYRDNLILQSAYQEEQALESEPQINVDEESSFNKENSVSIPGNEILDKQNDNEESRLTGSPAVIGVWDNAEYTKENKLEDSSTPSSFDWTQLIKEGENTSVDVQKESKEIPDSISVNEGINNVPTLTTETVGNINPDESEKNEFQEELEDLRGKYH